MTTKWIRWTQWDSTGMIGLGQMPVADVDKNLRKFEAEARKKLEETGADHVVYGLKIYNEDELESVKFYLMPMSDEDFEKDVASLRGCIVYAVHKRK